MGLLLFEFWFSFLLISSQVASDFVQIAAGVCIMFCFFTPFFSVAGMFSYPHVLLGATVGLYCRKSCYCYGLGLIVC